MNQAYIFFFCFSITIWQHWVLAVKLLGSGKTAHPVGRTIWQLIGPAVATACVILFMFGQQQRQGQENCTCGTTICPVLAVPCPRFRPLCALNLAISCNSALSSGTGSCGESPRPLSTTARTNLIYSESFPCAPRELQVLVGCGLFGAFVLPKNRLPKNVTATN